MHSKLGNHFAHNILKTKRPPRPHGARTRRVVLGVRKHNEPRRALVVPHLKVALLRLHRQVRELAAQVTEGRPVKRGGARAREGAAQCQTRSAAADTLEKRVCAFEAKAQQPTWHCEQPLKQLSHFNSLGDTLLSFPARL